MLPVNCGSHADYQNFVVTNLRKYYPDPNALTRSTWDSSSKRSITDAVMKSKYDAFQENDEAIIHRVAKIAQDHGTPMARIALAWQWARGIAAPIIGCSKPERVDDAVAALDVTLTKEEITFIEEPYVAHELVGPLARPGEKPLAGTTDPNKK